MVQVKLLETPPGPSGTPLRFVEHHPDFPLDGKPDLDKGQKGQQPRLVEVHGPNAFGPSSDCSNLTGMDAVITILYNYNPALLQKFLDPDEHEKLYFRYRTFKSEKYDIQISRMERNFFMKLWEGDDSEKQGLPYLEFHYYWRVERWTETGVLVDPPTQEWMPREIRGNHLGSPDASIKGTDFGRYATQMARYAMLLRPWEKKCGTGFWIFQHVMEGSRWVPRDIAADMPAVDTSSMDAVRINTWTHTRTAPSFHD